MVQLIVSIEPAHVDHVRIPFDDGHPRSTGLQLARFSWVELGQLRVSHSALPPGSDDTRPSLGSRRSRIAETKDEATTTSHKLAGLSLG
jgi:hypothetical protein